VSQDTDDRAVQVLVAEFQFVAGLIPFYRRAELIVLGATGALLSVIVAALATLEAAEESQRQAEGILLALGSWVPVLLMLIEVMALTRIVRASRYIHTHLHPRACELGGCDLLQFERSPSAELLATMTEKRGVREWLVIAFFSSAPLILAVATVSVALAIGGIVLDPGALTLGFGLTAVAGAIALARYGIAFTKAHEGRTGAAAPNRSAAGES
jgi:hypothetical protein